MGPVTPTNGPISEIQHGRCIVDSLEKVKQLEKNNIYRDHVPLLLGVFELKIQTKGLTLADNWKCLFHVAGVNVFSN